MNTHWKIGLAMLAGIAIGAAMATGLIAPGSMSAQQEPVKRTVLLKGDLEGIEGRNVPSNGLW
jgi:hypothetical protein